MWSFYINCDIVNVFQVIAWVTLHAYGNMWMFPWGNTVNHDGNTCERTEDYGDLVNILSHGNKPSGIATTDNATIQLLDGILK